MHSLAPQSEVADADFNAFNVLVAMDRIPEASQLLDRCETAFREDHGSHDLGLGLVAEARTELAARAGDGTVISMV
jgi:hypothetical protein